MNKGGESHANHTVALGQYHENSGQAQSLGRRLPVDDLCALPEGRGRGSALPHADPGNAVADTGGIRRAGQHAGIAGKMVPGTAKVG